MVGNSAISVVWLGNHATVHYGMKIGLLRWQTRRWRKSSDRMKISRTAKMPLIALLRSYDSMNISVANIIGTLNGLGEIMAVCSARLATMFCRNTFSCAKTAG